MIGFVTFEKTDNRIPGSIGSSRIRAKWLYERWKDAEEYQLGKKYDVLIFQKVYWEKMMQEFKGIKILDLCDPDWLEGRDVMRFCHLCDAIVTSTEVLADYVRKYITDKPVVCIPDRINMEEHAKPKMFHNEVIKSAVWFGYFQNSHYLDNTIEHLKAKNIKLTVVSDKPYMARDYEVRNVGYAYPAIHEELIKHDIALMPNPALKDLKGTFKSNNKLLTCWALGLPVVQTPEDLQRLASKEARKRETKEKMTLVCSEYDVSLSIQEYKDLIDEVAKTKAH